MIFINLLATAYFVYELHDDFNLADYGLVLLGVLSLLYLTKMTSKDNETLIYKITIFCVTIGYSIKYFVLKQLAYLNLADPQIVPFLNSSDLNIKALLSINVTLIVLFISIIVSKVFLRTKKKPESRSLILQSNKTKAILIFLLIFQTVLGVLEVSLGIGVQGIKTDYFWGVAGIIHYTRIIAIPLILYGILDVTIKSNNITLQKITLAELSFLGITQMFISSSRGMFLYIMLPALTLYYLNGKLTKRHIVYIASSIILLIIVLHPIITASRYFRYQYGTTKLTESLKDTDVFFNNSDFQQSLYFPILRFSGYDSLLYSISGTDTNKNIFDAFDKIWGDYDLYFTYEVIGYETSDEKFRMAPGLIGAMYSLDGTPTVIIGCLIFFLFWFSLLKNFSHTNLITGNTIYSFLLFQYFTYLSEGYIEMSRYIKFSIIFLFVFIINEKILRNITFENSKRNVVLSNNFNVSR